MTTEEKKFTGLTGFFRIYMFILKNPVNPV